MRRVLAAVLLLLAPAAAFPAAEVPPVEEAPWALTRAEALLDGPALLGRTARGWMAWAEARLDPPAADEARGVPLGDAVAALYGALGATASQEQRADLDARVAAFGPGADAFGALVAQVAAAYEAQREVVAAVDPSALGRGEPLLPLHATALGLANAERVLAALEAFRAQADQLPPGGFRDPLGLVVLGSSGDDVFLRQPGAFPDPVLLVDPAGDDVDLTAGGGACPGPVDTAAACNGLALAVRYDLAGHDQYRFTGAHGVAHGSGVLGGLGLLVDDRGDDLYEAQQRVAHEPYLTYYINGVMQGSGEAGLGLLVDRAGSDTYRFQGLSSTFELFGQAQGFAGLGGFGALLDGDGADRYEAHVTCTGARGQFCGVYVQATAIYPGVALLVDAGTANDVYQGILAAPQEDYYSQAFAAFGAFALMMDQGGDDDYLASATSTDPSGGLSLNCAYGTAMYAGAVAVFLDLGGDDRYVTETISPNPPHTMAEGFSLASASLFWDARGNDWHEMRSIGPSPLVVGRGTGSGATENSAFYLDSGGDDAYPDGLGSDGGVWGPSASNLGLGVDADLL